MRWFKHMTASGNDEKLSRLVDACGLEGYGFWWRMVEIVASSVDEKRETSVTFSIKKWCSLLAIRPQKFRRMAVVCKDCGLFELVLSEFDATVNMPNILKLCDEYTERKHKKSGQYRDKLPTRIEENREEDKNPPIPPPDGGGGSGGKISNPEAKPKKPGKHPAPVEYSASFLDFWSVCPQKTGKDAAYTAWRNVKKKHPDITPGRIIAAMKTQVEAGHFRGKDGQDYIPHPATWLNQGRWADEVLPQQARASPFSPPLPPEEIARRNAEAEKMLERMRANSRRETAEMRKIKPDNAEKQSYAQSGQS